MIKILITGGNGNIANIIKTNLSTNYDIKSPSRRELNILNINELGNFLKIETYDILIHTAINGGRRTKQETSEIAYNNILMFENILQFSNKFKMILNLDSAAIYDRSTDILHRNEEEIFTVPTDYYGFSKYVIYKRSLQYINVYNFRIYNIFHANEECERFIKSCFIAKQNDKHITIFEDKYFDFVYETDFITIVKYYLNNHLNKEKLEKTLNICYNDKYKLSDIAKLIITNDKIKILNDKLTKNYSGNGLKLQKLNLSFIGLPDSLKIYEKILQLKMNV